MVEPIVLGIVIGLVCISVAGLFVAAVGNWALSARLGMLIAVVGFYLLEPRPAWAFPAFAQQLYVSPIDATGKVGWGNCHLAEAPLRLSGPSAVFARSVFDLLIEIPTRVHTDQPGPSGDSAALNVGGVVVLPEGFSKVSSADSDVFVPYSAGEAHSYVFGPVPATDYATTVLAVLAPDAISLSYPIVVAGNRGRGQLYPDGTPSNNGGFRSSCNGWTGRVHISREGTNLACWTPHLSAQLTRLPAGVDLLGRRSSQLGTRVSLDTILTTNPNVGGVGQSEVLLVLQSRQRLAYYVQIVMAIAITQLALVLKKKQYERLRLGLDASATPKA